MWPWSNFASNQRRPYCVSVNSHSPGGLVSRQWDAVYWTLILSCHLHLLQQCHNFKGSISRMSLSSRMWYRVVWWVGTSLEEWGSASDFSVWSEVKWVTVKFFGDKSTRYNSLTLFLYFIILYNSLTLYLIILWIFHLACILYCVLTCFVMCAGECVCVCVFVWVYVWVFL